MRSRARRRPPATDAAPAKPGPGGTEKIQKVLSRAGLGSRRAIETWVEAGRITVDGKPATLGQRIEAHQKIHVDGRRLPQGATTPKCRFLIYHKPEGEVCTRDDPQGRRTVFDSLPKLRQGRWISIGRLDINSSGLLLLTNDGELAYRTMHPKYELEREYAVRVLGGVDKAVLRQLSEGVSLADGVARFESIKEAGGTGANHWYHVTLKEGRNREVRRLWDAVGVQVSRLMRIRYGPVALPRLLRTGRFRDLEGEEVAQLYAAVGLPVPVTQRRARSARGQKKRPDTRKR